MKEDYIGSKWKCPWCGKKEKVTKDGFKHSCKNYIENRTLEEVAFIRDWEKKREIKFWFGTK